MSMEKIVHDLRGPLARAKTLLKLLRDARGLESARYTTLLEEALNELDTELSKIVEKSDQRQAR